MRPLLRDHVWYAKAPDGAYIHGMGGACTLKGAQTYDWLDRLAPHLTGEHTLDELVAALTGEQRTMVRGLVSTLVEQQFVVDVDGVDDRSHTLDAQEQEIYAAEIAFVRFGLGSAGWRFQQLREARIGVIGAGPVLSEVLQAGLWSGWRHTRVVAPPAEAQFLGDAATRRDDRQELRVESSRGAIREWLPEFVSQVDVVLQVSSDVSRAELIAVARECHRSGTTLGQVLVDPSEAWLVPVGPPSHTAPESCWRRLAGRTGSADNWLIGPVPGLLAAQLVLSCFNHLTGLDTLPQPSHIPALPLLTHVDLGTLVTRSHQVQVHPRDEARGQEAPATLEELTARPPVDAERLLDRATSIVDARTGLLRLLAEDELGQVPLSVCRAKVSDPCGVLSPWALPPTVHGWGVDRQTARLRAVLAALAAYGTLTIPSEPEDVWGIDLVTGAPRRVPAAVAFPALDGATSPYRAPVGAAAAVTWQDAVAAGLRDHCKVILGDVDRTDHTAADLAGLVAEAEDDRVTELHGLLRAIGLEVAVEDLSDRLRLPAYSLRVGADDHVITCAATIGDALHDGLERVLLRWQAGLRPRGTYQPLRPTEGSGVTEFVDALRRHGQVPVVVPIARDPVARELLPHVVQVVLQRA